MTLLFQLLKAMVGRFWPFILKIAGSFLESAFKWSIVLSVAGLLGFTDVGKEICLWAFDGILSVFDYIITLVPVPDELKQFNLQSLFSSLPGQILGLMGYVGIPEVTVIISSAFVVRLTRDILRF